MAQDQLYTKILKYGQSAAKSIKPVAQQSFTTAQTFVIQNDTAIKTTGFGILAAGLGINAYKAHKKYRALRK